MEQQIRVTLQYSFGNDALAQGLANGGPEATSSPAPALVYKVLSPHSQPIHSRLYVRSSFPDTKQSRVVVIEIVKQKRLTVSPFKKFADLCFRPRP